LKLRGRAIAPGFSNHGRWNAEYGEVNPFIVLPRGECFVYYWSQKINRAVSRHL
jgi:hypothetical protein